MRLLFDHNVPAPLRPLLPGHETALAEEFGWEQLVNGDLIAAAERAGFEVLLTCDKNWRYQQNLVGLVIGIVVLSTNRWPHVRAHALEIMSAVERAARGSYFKLELPRPRLARRTFP